MTPERYVVQVFGETTDGKSYTGTGFLLNPNGDVATCWHVVENAREIFVKLPHTERWDYDVLDQREHEDLAVLRCKVPPSLETAHAALHPHWFGVDKIGAEVEMYGYANAANTDCALQLKHHIRGVSNKYGLITLDGHVNQGDSGAPILNAAGQVIGIADYKDTIREGHAMARPISRLCKLLKEKSVPFGEPIGGGDFAGRAIASLVELMQERQVHQAVSEYGNTFETASGEISALSAYKKMHDLLHEVEFGCYNLVVEAALYFPGHALARANMKTYARELSMHVNEANKIVRGVGVHSGRFTTVRDQLKRACDILQTAVQTHSKTLCEDAIDELKQLFYWAPLWCNMLLTNAVKEQNMQRLGRAMQRVQKAISTVGGLSAIADDFQLGVDDLAEMDRDLNELITQHDAWQELDDLLRSIDRNSPRLLSIIERSWPMIIRKFWALTQVAPSSTAPAPNGTVPDEVVFNWRALMSDELRNLQEAVRAGDLTGAREHFTDLHQQVAAQFDSVDKNLLEVCDKISKVKDPLRTLVEAL